MENNVFSTLYSVNVNEHTEKKNGLTYLSWAWAWGEVKKAFPDATYEIERFEGNLPYTYDPNTGYMCWTKMTIAGLTYEMWLPVMDGANKAMKAEPYTYTVFNPKHKYAKKGEDGKYRDNYGNEQPEHFVKTCAAATMFDINKTLMRCLVKNLAMFGLGLYIYAGEDLPEEATTQPTEQDRVADAEYRAIAIKFITDNIAPENIPRITKKYKVSSIAEMSTEQLRDYRRQYDEAHKEGAA